MRSQQEAERAEQQRIKSLVLNYELTDEHDGEEPAFHYVQCPFNRKRTILVGNGALNKRPQPRYNGGQTQHATSLDHYIVKDNSHSITAPASTDNKRHDSFADDTGSIDHQYGQPRADKSGNTRSKQRARKLQLGDIDWYGNRSHTVPQTPAPILGTKDSNTVPTSQHRRPENGEHRKNKR